MIESVNLGTKKMRSQFVTHLKVILTIRKLQLYIKKFFCKLFIISNTNR